MIRNIVKSGLLLVLLLGSVCAMAQVNANFSTVGPTSGCPPLHVSFLDQTTGGSSVNYTYSWNFQVGTSTLKNPSAIFTAPGTYTIILTVSDGSGTDVETKTGYITVLDTPVVNFSASPLTGCPPFNCQFYRPKLLLMLQVLQRMHGILEVLHLLLHKIQHLFILQLEISLLHYQ